MQRWIAVGVALALASGCSKKNDDAKAKANEQASSLKERGSELAAVAEAQKQKAIDHLKAIAADGEKYWDHREEHARAAVEAVRPYADRAGTSVSSIIVAGQQVVDKVGAIAREVGPKVGAGLGIQIIYEKLGDAGARAALDRAIGQMPRVEVIDGLTVGFSPQSKRQYLVVWRQGDALVGFVYTSLVDRIIDDVVARAPGLVKLVRDAAN